MEMVTKRDMDDAKGLGERSGLNMSDDWDEFIHDVAQTIADGRRSEPKASKASDVPDIRDRVYYKYSHIGCPAAHMEDNCAHPDRCADNGRCIDLGPNPFDQPAPAPTVTQEKEQ